jgi:UPF0271 protein
LGAVNVELNVDLGELPEEPDELYSLATVVNVACGGHAGDESSMDRAVELAARAGARCMAHPSYPDREGFGRVSMAIAVAELSRSLRAQCASLAAIARARGVALAGLKPHGALYHDAARDPALADAVAGAARELGAGAAMTLVGPPDGALRAAAAAGGLSYAREGFADRGYRADGSLLPRGQPGALLLDPAACAAQALALAGSGRFDTLCVHGDTPGALANARAVRRALEQAGLLRAPAVGTLP